MTDRFGRTALVGLAATVAVIGTGTDGVHARTTAPAGSGPAAVNDRLSALRAETIRGRLDSASRGLGNRLLTRGAGSRETIVGTGRDDATDALDRRVAFKVIDCS
ncbi:hypothetical protein [Rhodoplanes azumiensis]|uniref:OmpA-like domain-containing protein n=1 Tax=Rhodoplanes azumiensis TaxID=1897628 RepID=A0ABW5ALT8_9BRAD